MEPDKQIHKYNETIGGLTRQINRLEDELQTLRKKRSDAIKQRNALRGAKEMQEAKEQ